MFSQKVPMQNSGFLHDHRWCGIGGSAAIKNEFINQKLILKMPKENYYVEILKVLSK